LGFAGVCCTASATIGFSGCCASTAQCADAHCSVILFSHVLCILSTPIYAVATLYKQDPMYRSYPSVCLGKGHQECQPRAGGLNEGEVCISLWGFTPLGFIERAHIATKLPRWPVN